MTDAVEKLLRSQASQSFQSAQSIQNIVALERAMREASVTHGNTLGQRDGARPDGRFLPVSQFNPSATSG